VNRVGCGVVGDAGVYHPVDHGCGGVSATELKQSARDYGSHFLNQCRG
jgi:hypothetical protein